MTQSKDMKADWKTLRRELDRWAEAGQTATLWWRDDDCVAPSPALDRLLAIAETSGVPLALAVVPAKAEDSLPARLAASQAAICVLQHGYSHTNHAPAEQKKQELDHGRTVAELEHDLARGAARMAALFNGSGVTRLPVLVPPWNRIAAPLVPHLPQLGFRGLSTDGPRPDAEAAPGLVQVNVHVDLLRAHRKRGSVDSAEVLADLAEHLAARRTGSADPDEPSGLMTHHLVHDPMAWDLLEALLASLASHSATRFVDANEAFAGFGDRSGR